MKVSMMEVQIVKVIVPCDTRSDRYFGKHVTEKIVNLRQSTGFGTWHVRGFRGIRKIQIIELELKHCCTTIVLNDFYSKGAKTSNYGFSMRNSRRERLAKFAANNIITNNEHFLSAAPKIIYLDIS